MCASTIIDEPGSFILSRNDREMTVCDSDECLGEGLANMIGNSQRAVIIVERIDPQL